MDSSVLFEFRDSVALISLQSPDEFPRLTRAVLRELQTHLEAINGDSAYQAAVLTGTATAFAAGADLAEVSALAPLSAISFSKFGQKLMCTIEACRVPVIAAIRGYCLGGGFDLAMACHVRIAGEDARFGHPGGSLGIITGWGGTARLPRIVGSARAHELLTTGRVITAAEALAWRLVSRSVPPESVVEESLKYARCLSGA